MPNDRDTRQNEPLPFGDLPVWTRLIIVFIAIIMLVTLVVAVSSWPDQPDTTGAPVAKVIEPLTSYV